MFSYLRNLKICGIFIIFLWREIMLEQVLLGIYTNGTTSGLARAHTSRCPEHFPKRDFSVKSRVGARFLLKNRVPPHRGILHEHINKKLWKSVNSKSGDFFWENIFGNIEATVVTQWRRIIFNILLFLKVFYEKYTNWNICRIRQFCISQKLFSKPTKKSKEFGRLFRIKVYCYIRLS